MLLEKTLSENNQHVARLEGSAHLIVWKIESSQPLGLNKTAWLAEGVRRGMMSKAGQILGERQIPEVISGHSAEGILKRTHASYLPLDVDQDGHLDHVVLHLPEPPTDQLRMAIFSLRHIHLSGESALMIPLYLGPQKTSPVLGSESSRHWVTVSPWAHPWHLKKNFGLEEQLKEELKRDGLPSPSVVEFSEGCFLRGPACNVRQFPYRRPGKELVRHSVQLKFVKIGFDIPVEGPLLLGRARHFGYGLFQPSAS